MSVVPRRRPNINVKTGMMSCLFFSQNGVADAAKHYGSGVSSSQIVMDSKETLHGNNVPKRPKNLEVSASNGYAAKSHCEDVEDGSLPCTPELQLDSELDVPSCPAGDQVLESNTRQLLSQFLNEFTGLSSPRWTDSKELTTLRRVVGKILEKHKYTYNGMLHKLSLDDRGDDVSFVSSVAESLFSDGTTNWGRIVSLVALGAIVCRRLKELGRDNCVEQVSDEITRYLVSEQRDWLVKNNSWDGFVEFFHEADPESTLRNTLLTFVGVFGIGASLALLTRSSWSLRLQDKHNIH